MKQYREPTEYVFFNFHSSSQANQTTGHQKRRPSFSVLRPSASWYIDDHAGTCALRVSPLPCHTLLIHPVLCLCFPAEDTDGLGGSVEDRSVYGVENSSMFLECSPKSQRALIYWQLQKPNDDRRHEVRIGPSPAHTAL